MKFKILRPSHSINRQMATIWLSVTKMYSSIGPIVWCLHEGSGGISSHVSVRMLLYSRVKGTLMTLYEKKMTLVSLSEHKLWENIKNILINISKPVSELYKATQGKFRLKIFVQNMKMFSNTYKIMKQQKSGRMSTTCMCCWPIYAPCIICWTHKSVASNQPYFRSHCPEYSLSTKKMNHLNTDRHKHINKYVISDAKFV